ncbi:MAG: glycosyltransferase family 39 protein [Fimbriimonadia bacterium]|jgi:4-amino-4-deoxy-L-arabinose transferase-like glycosyltransferase
MHDREAAFRRRLTLWLLVALLLRLANVVTLEQAISDEQAYLKIASNLVRGDGFHEGGVVAYRYPAYVGFMAGFFEVFGEKREPVVVAQALMGVATILLFGLVVRRRLGDVAALFSVAVLSVYVPFVRLAGRMYTENLFFLLVLLVWWLLERPGRPRLGQVVLAGVLCGLAVLTREAFLPMALLYVIARVATSSTRRDEAKGMAVFLACAVLTVAPWTLRNYMLFERIVPVTSNGWFNLYMGNSAIADGRYPERAGEILWSWPAGEPRRSKYLEMDLADRFRTEVLRFWREDTGRALELVGVKALLLITPPHMLDVTLTGKVAELAAVVWSVMWGLMILLAVYGFVRGPMPFRETLWPWTLAAMAVLSCLATYVIARYRFPLELAMVYFAANGFIAALTPVRRASEPDRLVATGG